MKALIWFGCFFVATILNTLLGYATGVKAGYLVFYLVVYFVAKKLCKMWDERHVSGNIVNRKESYVCFCRKCGTRLAEESNFCRKCGAEKIKDLETYYDEKDKFCEKCGSNITHDIDNCHICFKKINRNKE